MPDLDRYYEPENGDLCMTRKFIEPSSHSYSVTLAGYNVYIALCVVGAWQHCRFSVAPPDIQEEAYAFMRHFDEYAPTHLPGLFVKETRRNNRWTVTGVIEDGDILDPGQNEAHRIIKRYNEALMAPLPPKPTNTLPAPNTV